MPLACFIVAVSFIQYSGSQFMCIYIGYSEVFVVVGVVQCVYGVYSRG